MVHIHFIVRVWSIRNMLVAFIGFISCISCPLVDIVSVLIGLRISISMVLLFYMDMSRSISISMISRSSGSLVISVVVGFWVVNFNLVIRIWPVNILVAVTTMAISSIS